jgi:hypothetical protein
MGDHSEAIQIDYNPDVISYGKLLDVFWESHDPTRRSWSRQYRSAVFVHDTEQERVARQSRERQEVLLDRTIRTAIEPHGGFTLAEDYHQKHALRLYPEFIEAVGAMYPDITGLVSSTATARLNGFLGGYGDMDLLRREVGTYGLPDRLAARLLRIVENR